MLTKEDWVKQFVEVWNKFNSDDLLTVETLDQLLSATKLDKLIGLFPNTPRAAVMYELKG